MNGNSIFSFCLILFGDAGESHMYIYITTFIHINIIGKSPSYMEYIAGNNNVELNCVFSSMSCLIGKPTKHD